MGVLKGHEGRCTRHCMYGNYWFMIKPGHPALHKVLKTVFGGSRYRYCSHNDIGIDRIVGWHKDVLNDKYKHYQSLPLWQDKPQSSSACGSTGS